MSAPDRTPPVGLVAGWGSFPIEVARQITASGRDVCCVAIVDHAAPELEDICKEVCWLGIAKFGSQIRFFRRHNVSELAMAGKLFKSDLLFQGNVVLKHLPDWTSLRLFWPLFFSRRRDLRDDSLLSAVTDFYSGHAITVCPATDFAPELLVNQGHLIGKPLCAKQQSDVQSGWAVAKQMGGMDIGQSITIKDGTVLAVEAVEGTDACIQRTGELCRRGGWVLVKVSKPDQDMRFDVPTIGPQTVEKVAAGGGTVIAIEADKTIVVERERTLQLAQKHGITIVAMRAAESLARAA